LKPPDSQGSVWFSGDLHNTLPQEVKIRLQAKAYSASGELLDSKAFYSDPMDIPPYGHGTFNQFVDAKGAIPVSRVVVVPINR
jgi:hypothetical protein